MLLGDPVDDYVAGDVGEAEVSTRVAERQPLVIDPQLVQDHRVHVVDRQDVLDGSIAELAGLPNKLRSEITRLDMGEKSGVIMLGDKAYIAKVTGLNERPARSFESVRDEIEETLEPRLYRDAVKELQSEALGNVEVTYSFK